MAARVRIIGHRPRRRRGLTKADSATPPAPDLVGRLFNPDQPDVAWCGDITYIPTDEGWLYLASVLDLASRHLLGWSINKHRDAGLVVGALDAAATLPVVVTGWTARSSTPTAAANTPRPPASTSASGWGYYRRSIGRRTGSCLDNAVAESFFATLKVELVDRCRCRTPRPGARLDLRLDRLVQDLRRLHSTNGYLPPAGVGTAAPSCAQPLPSTLAA